MEKVTKIINDWDPIGFFPMAPKDEYMNEIKKICEYIYNNPNICIQTLAETIDRIFAETFGTDVYDENVEKCMMIAEKILSENPNPNYVGENRVSKSGEDIIKNHLW